MISERLQKHGTVAFITTPRFRERHSDEFVDFVLTELRDLCWYFVVRSTGGTHDAISNGLSTKDGEILFPGVSRLKLGDPLVRRIRQTGSLPVSTAGDLKDWQGTILHEPYGMQAVEDGYCGMMRLTNDLVMGKIDAVVHLMDWDDVQAKPDTAVLRRQANVHPVPMASDMSTARLLMAGWKARIMRNEKVFETPEPSREVSESESRLDHLTDRDDVLALIAHDGMKLPMCHFVVENWRRITEYDAILATGTTGSWVKKYLIAAGADRALVESKVICCLSGPEGGDVQVAWQVVRGVCGRVVFFMDPRAAHPHESDIRLFEQALLYHKVRHALAPNAPTGRDLICGPLRRDQRSTAEEKSTKSPGSDDVGFPRAEFNTVAFPTSGPKTRAAHRGQRRPPGRGASEPRQPRRTRP
jgi:methylglyoxal synthase